jgi:hypothetical protein
MNKEPNEGEFVVNPVSLFSNFNILIMNFYINV